MIASSIDPFIFTLTLLSSYQLTSGQALSKDLTFCLNQPTTSSTLQTFWHDAASDCELEPERLIELYRQLNEKVEGHTDRCTLLLNHQMRKRVIAVVSQQLEEAFITLTLRENRELSRSLAEIHEMDKRISEAIWQRTLNEIHLFVRQEEIVETLLQLKSDAIQVAALQYLLSKSKFSLQGSQHLLPLITHTLATKLFKSKSLTPVSLENLSSVYQQLPQELQVLYALKNASTVGLLNRAHWEFLYAPRDNGPDSERRLPLTWSQDKNTTDADGQLLIEFSAKGLVAFASLFAAAPKFLYDDVDNQAAYFWIGKGSKASGLWWQVIWPHDEQSMADERPVAFQNYDSKRFLCATNPYDENRRYVTLSSAPDSASRLDCQWLVRDFS